MMQEKLASLADLEYKYIHKMEGKNPPVLRRISFWYIQSYASLPVHYVMLCQVNLTFQVYIWYTVFAEIYTFWTLSKANSSN